VQVAKVRCYAGEGNNFTHGICFKRFKHVIYFKRFKKLGFNFMSWVSTRVSICSVVFVREEGHLWPVLSKVEPCFAGIRVAVSSS
jgi:hypothetical protein